MMPARGLGDSSAASRRRRRSPALLALVLAACGPRSPRPAADEVPWAKSGIDWTRPPTAAAPSFVPPRITETTLGNGARLVVVENHRLPIVSITAIHHAAGGREDGAKVGLAGLTADLLDERPGGTAGAVADLLERTGSRLEIDIASDHASLKLATVKDRLAESLRVFAGIQRDPSFSDEEVARVRDRRVAELLDRRTRSRTVAGQLFDRLAFAGHPYAAPAEGTPEAVRALTAEDVRDFYARAYRPDALTLVVAGDLTREDAERAIGEAFGGWRHAPMQDAPPPPLAPMPRQLAYVDVPGAEQTVAIIGKRTPAAGRPDQVAADVANAIVGGGPGARLDRKLHDELAVTLGAGSSSWRGRWAGTWAVATTFLTDRTGDGLRAALAVIEHARTTAPTAAELEQAKASLARTTAQHFETTASTVRALERVIVQGAPPTRYNDVLAALARVTPEAARAAIEEDWAELSIVVVGDWAKIGPDLRALGLPVVPYGSDGTRRP
jgi:zinc protease